MYSGLGGPNSKYGLFDKEKDPYPYRESNTGCLALSLIIVLTELPRKALSKYEWAGLAEYHRE